MTDRVLAFGVALLLVSCSQTVPPGLEPGANLNILVGQSAPYRLYTHCGVRSATLNGTTFYADPPLSDGSGNPPAGWRNPFDDGVMKLVTSTSANFTDAAGHRAHFTSTPSGPTPSVPMCS